MNFVDDEPMRQTFDQTPSGPLQEPSDYTLLTPSQSPQMAAGYKLKPYDILSPDYLSTPVALEAKLDVFADSESMPWPTPYIQDFDVTSAWSEPNEQDVAKGMRKERRRAQNRRAQKAFRERKDKAIERLEDEVVKLNAINQSLSTANTTQLREIQELKAELEALSFASPTSSDRSCYEGWDFVPSERGSVSSDKTSTSATTPMMPFEATEILGPFIKWSGRVYVDAESLAKQQPKECN